MRTDEPTGPPPLAQARLAAIVQSMIGSMPIDPPGTSQAALVVTVTADGLIRIDSFGQTGEAASDFVLKVVDMIDQVFKTRDLIPCPQEPVSESSESAEAPSAKPASKAKSRRSRK